MSGRYVSMLLVFLLGASLTVPAETTTAAPDVQPISQVRIVHAAPGLVPLDVLADGLRIPPPAPAFGLATPYLNFPAGSHGFALVPVGAAPPVAVVNTTLELAPGQSYTLMVIGAPPTLMVLEDTRFGTIAGPARVRFMHASPDVAAMVDIVMVGGTTLFAGVGYGEATAYIDLPAGTVSLEVREAGTTNVILSMPDLALLAGTVYTFAVVGLANGTPPLGPLTLIDS